VLWKVHSKDHAMTALFVQPQAWPPDDHANRVTPLSGTPPVMSAIDEFRAALAKLEACSQTHLAGEVPAIRAAVVEAGKVLEDHETRVAALKQR
jgi:hypothetical protein